MSVWTHINGQIRLDKWHEYPKPNLGKMALITANNYGTEEIQKTLSLCEVPCGSEGSLRWLFHENPHSSSVYWGYISIDGDLRDYDNIAAIAEWLNKYIYGHVVRQGVVQVQIGTLIRFIIYDYDHGWTVS